MRKKLFTFLLAIVASMGTLFAANKYGTCGATLTWSLNTSTGVLTISGTGAMTNYNDINSPAPWYNNGHLYITSIVLNDGITNIGNNAFYYCTNLTSVTIPNSVKSIGERAFFNCKNLASVTIPNSVTSIGDEAFTGCIGLTSLTIPNSVKSIGEQAFSSCIGLTTVTIPNSVTSIGGQAFSSCRSLTSPIYNSHIFAYMPTSYSGAYTIPDGIEAIAGYAFLGCTSLTSVSIPNSVTSIGNGVFNGCTGLTSITIPNSITSIGYNVFDGCSSLPVIDNIRYADTYLVGAVDKTLTSYTIKQGTKWIGNNAFSGCSDLTSIEIPNSVTSIEGSAFAWCTGLTSITIPNSVTSIGDYAFDGCNSLPVIDNIRYADTYLVGAVDKTLTSYTIKQGTKWIGNNAFYNCTGLTTVTIPNSVTSIEGYAFAWCRGLTSVTIPNSVTSIGECAFYYCSSLTSVTIPNSVTSIGERAFSDCTSLTSVTIPNSVTSIGERAFYDINNIYYSGSAYGVAWGALHINDEAAVLSTSQISSITSELSSNQTSTDYYLFSGIISSNPQINTSYGNATFYITDGTTTFYCYRIYDHYSTLFTNADQLSVGDSVVISSKVQNYKGNTPEATLGRLVYHSANPLFTPDSIMYYGKRKDNSSELKLYSAPDTSTLNIPETVTHEGTTYSVTEIAPGAMYKHKNIKCVVLPRTLKLMPNAFELCDSIETLYYNAENLTKPTTIPFVDSKLSLKNVYIGEDVKTIPEGIFNNLENISTVHWDATNCEDMQYSPFYYSRTKIQEFGIANIIEHIPANMCWGMPNITEVTIPNTTTYIGKDAFHSCTGLATLYLGENISTYGDSAFAGCSNLTSIYNYRERPVKLGTGTFDDVDYFNCTLYVLAGSVNMYKSTGSDWKDFYFVESIGAETVITENVVVTPNNNTANFVWPSSATADSYTLDIVKNGELICTLHFNANGQLTSIAFNAPARNGNSAPQQTNEQVAGFSFTVTGLNAATKYGYTLTAKDNSGNVVETYTGTFATEGYVASQYTITFVNYDGTELQSSEVAEGEIPAYNGPTPAKPEDEQFTYTFTGWTPEISAVSEDATYTATFEATSKSEGIEDLYLDDAIAPHKIFRDGQIFILRGEKVYTLQGQEVR